MPTATQQTSGRQWRRTAVRQPGIDGDDEVLTDEDRHLALHSNLDVLVILMF
jgi:hypothetical protein